LSAVKVLNLLNSTINFYQCYLIIGTSAGLIVGSFTDWFEFSPSKQILLFNLKLGTYIPHSSQSTFVKQ